MRFLLPFALSLTCAAQTVVVSPASASASAPIIPAGTTLCTVPKNGGACKTAADIALPKLAVAVAAPKASVSLSGLTLSGPISCTNISTDAAGNITGAICTLMVKSK